MIKQFFYIGTNVMCVSPSIVATILAQLLKELGINVVAIDKQVLHNIPALCKKSSEGILHYIAVSLVLGRIRVCAEEVPGIPIGFYKGITLLSIVKKGYSSDAFIVKRGTHCVNRDVTEYLANQLVYLLPRTPVFIIDLSLWEIHHEKEIPSLIKQLAITISTIRRWLTDLNLVFVSIPQEARQRLQDLIPNVCIYYSTPDIYKVLDPSRTVLLDPYASDSLSEDDARKYDYFVIGGVIDKMYPRPFATYMIYKMHKLNITRKVIKLRGTIIGVPNELNKIVDIILWVRLGGATLDEAIIKNMSKDDKLARIIYDIEKIIRSGKSICSEDLRRYMEIYGLDEEFMKRIFLMINKFKS